MKEKTLRVIKYSPTKLDVAIAETKEIENSLKSLQDEVDGYIELTSITKESSEMGIFVLVNEEGLLKDLKPSVIYIDKDENINGALVGNIVFIGLDDGDDWKSLTDEQIEYIRKNILVNYVKVFNTLDDMATCICIKNN